MTLLRKLEPEVMDSPEEASDYDAMDHSAVNAVFAADFFAVWDGRNPVLDLGTGTAQIPVELCRWHPGIAVTAVDASRHMLELAGRNVAWAGLADRIRLQQCDAKRLPFPDGSFSAVISNSIVHHIPDPAAVLAEAVRVLAPGGTLFLRDLHRPPALDRIEALVETYAMGANAHQRQMFADSLHAALTVDELRPLVAALGFDPSGVRQTTDRHWTWAAVKAGGGP